MPAQKYSVVVFDLGKVLINFDYQIALEKFNMIEPGLGEQFLEHHKNNYHIHRSFESGKISEDEFIKISLSAIDNKIDRLSFCKIYSEIFTPNVDVISLLPVLKNNYKLLLLSNTDPLHKKYGWEQYEFLNQFDHKILSFEVKAVKPEANIYKAVEQFSQLPSNQHLYIDDIAEYVDAAKNLGWDAIHFRNYEQLVYELGERGVF